MKKIFILLSVLCFLSLPVIATSEEHSTVSAEATIFEFPKKERCDFDSSREFWTYRSHKRMYEKGKYKKILKKHPNSPSALYGLYQKMSDQKKYKEAIDCLNKLKNIVPSEHKLYVSELLVSEYYMSKEYKLAIEEFNQIHKQTKNVDLYAYVADSYLKIGNLEKALLYASKVKPANSNYYLAQEVKYSLFKQKGDIASAKIFAKKLISLQPHNSDNYLKMVGLENSINSKLIYLYKARDVVSDEVLYKKINLDILNNEEKRLQNYYNSTKKFVERVSWKSIVEYSPEYDNYEYWQKRQDEFFKSCNICITQYKDEEASRCFKSLKDEQYKLTQQLNYIVSEEKKKKYREEKLRRLRNYEYSIDSLRRAIE